MTNASHTDPIHYVAIGISKDTLQIQDENCSFTTENTPKGYRKLLGHLKDCPHPLSVFEASGDYERNLCQFLHKEGISLAMLNPAKARDFARSEAVCAKPDPIDTKMILAFAKSKAVQAMKAPSQNCIKLAALLDRRGHLVGQLTREK